MDVPAGMIIGGTAKIAEYFGLVETVNTKILKLLHQQFNAAIRNLENARYASGQTQVEYIKQARTEFNQAVSVEENENKILALVGLSMCQYMLGDSQNADRNFNQISTLQLTRTEICKYGVLYGKYMNPVILAGSLLLPFDSLEERLAYFESVKSMSQTIRHKLLH